MRYPTTPDGRYFVVRGRLWRCYNPSLPEGTRQGLVDELMAGRSAVRRALKSSNSHELAQARFQVDTAKRALGERGPVWWTDGALDMNRKMAKNTEYADWFKSLPI